jgi:hypothetical protein
MIKLTAVLKRNPALSLEEFEAHWLGHHARLMADTPELARHIVRYEQHRRLPEPSWAGSEGFDGITVQWYRSMDDFLAFLAEPKYAELVGPDEEVLLDRDATVWLMTEEAAVAIDGGTGGPGSAG